MLNWYFTIMIWDFWAINVAVYYHFMLDALLVVMKINLRWIDSNVRNSSDGLEDVSKDVEEGNVDNSFELSKELVCNPCS